MIMVIDFDRLNFLTTHVNDNPGSYGGMYNYAQSRKIIKLYMDIYMDYNSPQKFQGFQGTQGSAPPKDQYDLAVKTLRYNKILLDDSDIRDNKINKILDE